MIFVSEITVSVFFCSFELFFCPFELFLCSFELFFCSFELFFVYFINNIFIIQMKIVLMN